MFVVVEKGAVRAHFTMMNAEYKVQLSFWFYVVYV